MAYVIDASIWITYLRGRAPGLPAKLVLHPPAEIKVPVVVWGELLLGAEKSSQTARVKRELEALLAPFELLPVSPAVAEEYARIRAELEACRQIIGPNDFWIAATALTHGATVVTQNVREFQRVQGLKVVDWTK
jgi:tRNA(fMet)-specific endonuclease VapC